jgi:hypothetical protein
MCEYFFNLHLNTHFMKKIILLLMLIAVHAHAQNTERKYVTPDQSKILGRTFAVMGTPVPCGGSSNTQSVDLNWKPILVKKYTEIEHDAPNQPYIDSIKAVKLQMKQEYEKSHPAAGNKTTSVTPVVGAHFAGNTNDGYYPLDNTMAISNGGIIVSVINDKIEVYNTSGTNLYTNTLVSFLSAFTIPSGLCDPVVLYDPGADRFIFFCQESPLVSGSKIYVCFSKTNDPSTGGWWCYQIYGDPTPGNTEAFDYPKMAVNDSEVFITGNEYAEPGGTFDQAVIFQMDKLAGLAGGTLNYVYYAGITGAPFTLLPAGYGQGADVSTGMVLVSTVHSGGSSINLYSIVGNWCCGPTLSYWSVPTTPYSVAANAAQMGTGTLLDVGNCKALSGMYENGILHFAFNSDAGSGYTGINYNRLTLSVPSNVSSIYGVSGYDYAYPAVGAFTTSPTDASVMIGYGRSGSSIYPEMGAINCDNAMSWSGTTLVKSSSTYVGSGTTYRWGDYTGMSRNHASATPSVWMSGSFADASNLWDTWISEIHAGTSTTGINGLKNISTAKVFPNPVKENDFTVEFSLTEHTDINISVVDATGKIVKELYNGKATSGDNIFSFNKANLAQGVYFLNIKSNTQVIKNEKIVIAN